MRVLIAEDDVVTARVVAGLLRAEAHDVTVVQDGLSALAALIVPESPALALLDWMLPGADGPEICATMRECPNETPTYRILLTARNSHADIVRGLDSGADDYLGKPFDFAELRARVKSAARVVALQQSLSVRVRELQNALASVKILSGLLPICGYCKSICDDDDYWHRVEEFVGQ
jgi:sigma-B regulation protein RsbU (phosphoserine phosphatase)